MRIELGECVRDCHHDETPEINTNLTHTIVLCLIYLSLSHTHTHIATEDLRQIEKFAADLESSTTTTLSSFVSSQQSSRSSFGCRMMRVASWRRSGSKNKDETARSSRRRCRRTTFGQHRDSFEVVRRLARDQNKGYVPRKEHPLLLQQRELSTRVLDEGAAAHDC